MISLGKRVKYKIVKFAVHEFHRNKPRIGSAEGGKWITNVTIDCGTMFFPVFSIHEIFM